MIQGYLLVGVVVDVSIAILGEYPELGGHYEHLQSLQQKLPRQLPRMIDYYKIIDYVKLIPVYAAKLNIAKEMHLLIIISRVN